jgi:hypothetical protein
MRPEMGAVTSVRLKLMRADSKAASALAISASAAWIAAPARAISASVPLTAASARAISALEPLTAA